VNAGRVLLAVITLLTAGLLLWSTTVPAFSFCFSSGSKGRGGGYSHFRYYPPYGAWLPPPVPVMSYSPAPYPDPYIHPEPPVSESVVTTEENQGLDYIMPRAR
jgi:hypothetical protein